MGSLILDWWNAFFTGMIVIGMVPGVMSALGLIDTGVDHDVDCGADCDHDVDIDHDIDMDISTEVHADMDHDVGHDHEVEHDANVNHGIVHDILGFLGAGKCPLGVVMTILFMTWGVSGNCINGMAREMSLHYGLYFLPSLIISGFVAVGITRLLARMISSVMPKVETNALKSKTLLVGKTATTSLVISHTFGRCRVHDDAGTLHNVSCITETEDEPRIPPNEEVILCSRNRQGVFIVKRKPSLADIRNLQ